MDKEEKRKRLKRYLEVLETKDAEWSKYLHNRGKPLDMGRVFTKKDMKRLKKMDEDVKKARSEYEEIKD